MSNVELSGKGLIGTGFAEAAKEVGKQLRLDFEANHERRENERLAQESKQYVGKCDVYVRQKDLGNGWLQVETTDELPLIGRIGAIGRGWLGALANLRMAYANELKAQGLIPNLDDARRYVVRYEWRPDLTADLL